MSDQDSIDALNMLIPPTTKLGEAALGGCPLHNNGHQNGDGEQQQQHRRERTETLKANEAATERSSSEGSVSIGGCPFFAKTSSKPTTPHATKKFPEWQTSISIASEPIVYQDYLQLDKILDAQFPVSKKYGKLVHDEHLFIVVHQAYEVWFKQIIFELDSINELLGKTIVDDRCILVVVQRVQRINLIWKLLNDQIAIMETMAPTDFLDFRGYLTTSSGFQSLQFRVLENKLGLTESARIKFNQQKYDYVFTDDESRHVLDNSVTQPSLLKLITAWLERTPGLTSYDYTENGKVEYNYLLKEYEKSVHQYLKDTYVKPAEEETDESERQSLLDEYKKTLDAFTTIFDEEKHKKLLERGERKLSHKALWGALFIWLNRDEPRFHLPYQLLSLLTDLDALINRWRYNHALLAQRQVGNKSGTGGSSGYSYLRSTASDRYKIFNDIVNLSTWLIPREYVPQLTDDIRKRLNTFE